MPQQITYDGKTTLLECWQELEATFPVGAGPEFKDRIRFAWYAGAVAVLSMLDEVDPPKRRELFSRLYIEAAEVQDEYKARWASAP